MASSRRCTHPKYLLRWKYLRWIAAGFLLINVVLFVHVHTLTITSDTTIPIQIPIFRKGGSTTTAKKRDHLAPSAPVPSSPWNNSLFEGSVYVERYRNDNKNLWDHSTILPDWMKEYFVWHRERRNFLIRHPDEWKSVKYYLVECSDDFNACGGTADRLGPLPFHIQMASSMGRLLLIHWGRPAPLETYLLPPIGGLDWRVPTWLLEEFQRRDRNYRMAAYEEKILSFGKNPLVILLRVKYQSHNHGQECYDQNRATSTNNNPTYAQVYHDLWRVCFTPVPVIADRIEEQMKVLGLQPGNYISVHIRALYAVETRDENIVTYWARNGIRCATSQFPISAPGGRLDDNDVAMPFLFVSDSTLATQVASDYGQQEGIRVVHREHEGQEPFHLEKAVGRSVEEFYDTFVDIYMIGMARCTAYNMGGFGRWGSMIGYNSSCVAFLKANMETCEFSSRGRKSDESKFVKPKLRTPLFLPPMPETSVVLPEKVASTPSDSNRAINAPADVSSWNFSDTLSSYNLTLITQHDPQLYAPFDTTATNNYLWKASKTIPTWMKKYFRWHHQQRLQLLNPSNRTALRLLVMECLEGQDHCGGTSDRLKPLPTMIRFAAITKRLLLIHWRRPAKLEEFLLPPKGGVDWRVPEWLRKSYRSTAECYSPSSAR
jgi:hypothetical protein